MISRAIILNGGNKNTEKTCRDVSEV